MKRWLLVALMMAPGLAPAQQPDDSVLWVSLPGGESQTLFVGLHWAHGIISLVPVPEGCDQGCVLRIQAQLPEGPIWAVAYNEFGASAPSNARRGEQYPTTLELADLNRDGGVNVFDVLLLNQALFGIARGLPGDADLDGSIDIADLILVSRELGADPPIGAADANGDGEVDIDDVLWINQNIFGQRPDPADVNRDGSVDINDVLLVNRIAIQTAR